MAGDIGIGIGGWTFAPWRGGVFYPKGHRQADELAYASRAVTSIEINGTYYGAQKPETFAKWHDEAPDDFMFAVKGPRYATNRRVLAEAGPSIEKFITGGVTRLGTKLGPINWQFMGTKKFDAEDFAAFLDLLPKSADGIEFKHAVEVRHESFACPEFVALARQHNVAIILAAHEKYPQIADITAPFVYVRLQTGSSDEPLGYDDAALDYWAGCAKQWANGKSPGGLTYADPENPAPEAQRDVFLYCIAGHKEHNPAAAKALISRL